MKRIAVLLLACALAALLAACEPAHENIVDTAEPMQTTPEGVKEAPGTHEAATSSASSAVTEAPAASATETATETAAQQSTRTQ